MAGIFLSFMVEYFGIRLVQWHAKKTATRNAEAAGGVVQTPQISTELVNISVLEAGVIFHSLCMLPFSEL